MKLKTTSSRALLAGVAAITALTALAGSTGQAEASGTGSGPKVTAVALANPGPGNTKVDKQDVQLDRTWSRSVDVDTVAQASATCDGCSALAATGHVIVAKTSARIQTDNVATAWNQCTGCTSTALSIQVVVGRAPRSLVAANRALAVNAACEDCESRAAAYQFVLLGAARDELTPRARDLIDQVRQLMAAALQAPEPAAAAAPAPQARSLASPQSAPSASAKAAPAPGFKAQLDALADSLSKQLAAEQGAPSVQVNSDVRTAG